MHLDCSINKPHYLFFSASNMWHWLPFIRNLVEMLQWRTSYRTGQEIAIPSTRLGAKDFSPCEKRERQGPFLGFRAGRWRGRVSRGAESVMEKQYIYTFPHESLLQVVALSRE